MKFNKIFALFFFSSFLIVSLIASQVNMRSRALPNSLKLSNYEQPKDTFVQVIHSNDSVDDDESTDSIDEFLTDSLSLQDADSIAKILQKKENLEDEEGSEDKGTVDIPPPNYSSYRFYVPRHNDPPLTRNNSSPVYARKGLENRHIALWQSHGLYYKQSQERWRWQRDNIFQTREDLYTQSYILPFVVPMLENAGANVLLPRERDTQTTEIIVDNDQSSSGSAFSTKNGLYDWQRGTSYGFANNKETYRDDENPFRSGSYMQVNTITSGNNESVAEWQPHFPKKDKYAVYISYKTLENSASNAVYTVYHTGGKTEFAVNQRMGGGTWIYLGTFMFDQGKNPNGKITLTNLSKDANRVITADAVKIGGGMGNISRKRSDLVTHKVIKIPLKHKKGKKFKTVYKTKYVGKGKHKKKKRVKVRVPVKRYKTKVITSVKHFYDYSTSEMPRFVEGSRYWLQWAGMPESVYSRTGSQSDYSDDFQSRGFWVNYISGGSAANPAQDGLKVPIDMALALHSDAGRTSDSVLGTLAIHTLRNKDGRTTYNNGISRWVGRDLTDKVQTQVVNDIRALYDHTWTRRQLWNKSYSESRVPEVPAMILELLSHDNFADMRYGQDPRFRFMVSRAIYKGVLRFVAEQNGYECVVQPLPVEAFSAEFADSATVRLRWKPVEDPLEKTASPTGYIVYTRRENGGFDNGEYVATHTLNKKIEKNKIYSFKVEAVNDGGRSFPSEILSVCKTKSDTTVLIVNGFNRISAPAAFNDYFTCGFNNDWDAGVPYINDYKTTGFQTDFRKDKKYYGEYAGSGLGTSNTDLEGKVIAGNTFDYPYIHGTSIRKAGYSFVSCSEKSVENGDVKLYRYPAVNFILGKERQWTTLKKNSAETEFKTFTPEMRKAMIQYADSAGNIFISGAHVASDLSAPKQTTPAEYGFLVNFLKLKWTGYKVNGLDQVSILGVKRFVNQSFNFYSSPNETSYYVEAPDALEATDKKAVKVGEYKNSGLSAGILYSGSYNICTFGFPFETIKSENERDKLMNSVLNFLFTEKKDNKRGRK